MSLDGADDSVSLGNPGALQLTGSMTVSAWVNSAAFPFDDAAVVSKRGTIGYQLDTTVDRGPRTIGFKLTSSNGGTMFRYGATALQLNSWYHVAGVYNASSQTMDVYLNGQLDNGELVGTVTATQQNSPQNVLVGQRPGQSGFGFNGRIDDVRIYGRALTPAEIQADMITPVAALADGRLSAVGTWRVVRIGLRQFDGRPELGATRPTISALRAIAWSAVRARDVRISPRLAASATTQFTDIGVTANTTYGYRVRARDGAGNLGPYSNGATVNDVCAGFANDTVVQNLNFVTTMRFLPDGKMLMGEIGGTIRVVPVGANQPTRRRST